MYPESPGFIPLIFGAAVFAYSISAEDLKPEPVENCATVTMVVSGGVDDKGNAEFVREPRELCVGEGNRLYRRESKDE